jgi:hypothetical protein
MHFLSKSFRFLYGLALFALYGRRIRLASLLRGKRVAIVGAANSAYHTGKGAWIDGFDYVIRINRAPYVLQRGEWSKDIGRKTDILFHSFFENDRSGGGPLDFGLYDSLQIRYVVNPVAAYSGYRVSFNFYKKYLLRRATFLLPRDSYLRIEKSLHPFKPTIGFCALLSVLETDFSELYITGFTFFRTAFGDGYRDAVKEASQVRKLIKDEGLHDPDLEFKVFSEVFQKNRNRNIQIDNELAEILRRDEEYKNVQK